VESHSPGECPDPKKRKGDILVEGREKGGGPPA